MTSPVSVLRPATLELLRLLSDEQLDHAHEQAHAYERQAQEWLAKEREALALIEAELKRRNT